jgi:ABC-type transport system involved in cytochrome c biogenesis ATPase subunit
MEHREATPAAPLIRINNLHVLGLRGLKRLELPTDGLSWRDDHIPDLVVIAGENGSGKTTLLKCIAQAARLLATPSRFIPPEVAAEECLIDFLLSDGTDNQPQSFRFLVGDEAFVEKHLNGDSYGLVRTGKHPKAITNKHIEHLRLVLKSPAGYSQSTWPRVALFPSEERDLVVPNVAYKSPGRLSDEAGFVHAWERLAGKQWSGSTIELLFSARWSDLNAKDKGSKESNQFERYTKAFKALTSNKKTLTWTAKGDLVVELKNGITHPVEDLSSGERQILLLLAELRRVWRPGSLVMIDELELHLHDKWQSRLLDVLRDMQCELGGQVLITTQSHSLFEMAGLGTRVLLGRRSLN